MTMLKTWARLDWRRQMPTLAALLILSLLAVGCSDDDDDDDNAGEADIRVMHLSPDAPAVDVYLDGATAPAVSDLLFNQGTGFLAVPAGQHDLAVAPANTSAASAVLSVSDVELATDAQYTAVAYAPLASIDAMLLVDNLSAPASGQIRVRAIHTASGVGQVDIWNVPSSGAPTPLYTNVNFGDAGGYLVIPAGSYRLGFDVNNDAVPDLTFTTPSLAAGTVANIFAVSDGSGNVYLLAQLQNSQVVRVNPDPA
ncbi:MAG TPA: DUF4397 domain-containing protein [Candidatus Eisenbacteria bacterium]